MRPVETPETVVSLPQWETQQPFANLADRFADLLVVDVGNFWAGQLDRHFSDLRFEQALPRLLNFRRLRNIPLWLQRKR